MLFTILMVILIIALLGALPVFPHSAEWGPYPSGLIGIILLIFVIYLVMGGARI